MFSNKSILLLLLIIPLGTRGQVQDTDELLQQKIELLNENSESESVDITTLMDGLQFYAEHKLDLNTATQNQFEESGLFNDFQINAIINHRQNTGDFQSVYELQTLDEFDILSINQILPYITVKQKALRFHWRDLWRGDHFVIARVQRVMEEKVGYRVQDDTTETSPGSYYTGSPEKYFSRYRYTVGPWLSLGITGEKDAGESFTKTGMDFYSAHFFLKTEGIIKKLAIGDFQAQFGQGLTFWSGLGFGKSQEAVSVKRYGQGFRPYTSADESRFLRGAAITAGKGHWELSVFGSSKRTDGSTEVSTDSLFEDDEFITSLNASGLHRTPAELERKGKVKETITGGNLTFKNATFQMGVTVIKSLYNLPGKNATELYNQFQTTQNGSTHIGIDYSKVIKNFIVFGEVAGNITGGFSTVNGFVASIHPKVNLSLLVRNFGRDYGSVHSNGFGESAKTTNEFGILTGVNIRITPKLTFKGYCDRFKFSWLKYRTDAPSGGFDYLGQLNYSPVSKMETYVRFRVKEKSLNYNFEESKTNSLLPVRRSGLRFNAKYPASRSLSFRSRVEFSRFNHGEKTETGYLFFQDVIYKPMMSKIALTARYALFNTDGYDSRIYAYEHDVLYGYSIPGYYYNGGRFYILIKFRPVKNLDFWLRVGRTFYNNRDTIGSGTEEISGDTKTELKFQVRVKF